ncbi:MAG: hypothetical protein IKV61_03805 [Clostridia bacterium]|nr:hypothetical protein [Clostridia bacterium]
MKTVSIPIGLQSVNEKNMHVYLSALKKCKANRIFIFGLGLTYLKTSKLYTETESIKKIVKYFKDNGLEVGIWIDALGHGAPLQDDLAKQCEKFTKIKGLDGKTAGHALCPSDKNFINAYANGIKLIATLEPDLIMLDDDFRINGRGAYYLGCFCDDCYKRYCERIGETLTSEQIEKLITTGEKNKYRDAYLDLMGEALLNFAKSMRAALDTVNPNIRLGACTNIEALDAGGISLIERALAFAGNTKPFSRICTAPYWEKNVIGVVEASRMQFAYGKNFDIELFAEGDTYPRTRYNTPSKALELFEMMLNADGVGDGTLSYLFNYRLGMEYEPGYYTRFVKNEEMRSKVFEMFDGKTAVGVRVFNELRKIHNYSMPKTVIENSFKYFCNMPILVPGRGVLSQNSIPTCYQESEYPVLVYGENAKHIDLSLLKNGAILDACAAKILNERGVDTGLISATPYAFTEEYFIAQDSKIGSIRHPELQKIEVDKNAIIESVFTTGNSPATYRYENANGQKFFVLAYNHFGFNGEHNENYLNNYYRQEQIIKAVKWLCGKELPCVITKNPNLYVLTKKDKDGNLAVLLANVSIDDAYDLDVKLDANYTLSNSYNFDGKVTNNTVFINRIEPYGINLIELKKSN